jgi:hypothetical protein
MALTANTIPSQVPYPPAPYDATNAFAAAQTLTATGYVNNLNQQLLIGGTNPVTAAGRTEGIWCMNITAIDYSSGDETYRLHLFGSNDVAWGNGNVELLAFKDFAAVTAGRQVPTIMGPSLAVPPTNAAGLRIYKPFSNLDGNIVYAYLRCYLVAGGTTPSITLTTWLSYADNDH